MIPDHEILQRRPLGEDNRGLPPDVPQANPSKRAKYLQECKDRALEILATGDVSQAFISLASDLDKEPETADAARTCQRLGLPLLVGGHLNTPQKMREFITGFN